LVEKDTRFYYNKEGEIIGKRTPEPMCGRCGHQEEFHWGIIGSLNCSILGCECKNFELQEYHCMICQKAITVYYSVLHQGNPTWCVECYNKNQPTVITDEQMKSLPRQIMTQDYTCIKCGAKATGSPSDEAWMCMDCYQKGNKTVEEAQSISKIKRYSMESGNVYDTNPKPIMVESLLGQFIKYKDYEQLRIELGEYEKDNKGLLAEIARLNNNEMAHKLTILKLEKDIKELKEEMEQADSDAMWWTCND
jgi:hypothetical protein